ncbi:hypothetical protein [Blautia sp.]|nr:hypothetical protein [Blautia sp.]
MNHISKGIHWKTDKKFSTAGKGVKEIAGIAQSGKIYLYTN